MQTINTILRHLESVYPLNGAAEWDNAGLLLGDRQAPCEKILTCLTITPEVVNEATRSAVQLIVSHHPVLFRATKRLNGDTSEGRLLLPLLRQGIAVFSPHTAFDNAPTGINQFLAQKLGLQKVRPLRERPAPNQYKLVVFVPASDWNQVSAALFEQGAGNIGNYEQCSFRVEGTGTFFGTENTNPTIGQKGQREEVREHRLEVIVPTDKLPSAIAAMRDAHSYEEPAFDVYPVLSNTAFPEGVIGTFPEPIASSAFVAKVAAVCQVPAVQIIEAHSENIQRIAIACGAAGEFWRDAKKAKADLFLTGEMRFHDCLAAKEAGLNVILPGHYGTERPAVEMMAAALQAQFPECEVWASRDEKDPLRTVMV